MRLIIIKYCRETKENKDLISKIVLSHFYYTFENKGCYSISEIEISRLKFRQSKSSG